MDLKALLAREPGLRLRAIARRNFYRHGWLRRIAGLALGRRLRFRGYDLSHIAFHPEEDAVGPVQRDEALLLFGLTRVLRPHVVVEVGFLGGQSAFNFLRALTPEATLYSFDITESAGSIARDAFGTFPNFVFQRVSQDAIEPAHVGGQRVDLLFLDASHDRELNQRTFDRLAPMVADDGVLVVHDTGAWRRERFGPAHHRIAAGQPQLWASPDDWEHQREEREFVNWILEKRPDYALVHLHSTKTLRHGMTLLQRRAPLLTGPVETRTARADPGSDQASPVRTRACIAHRALTKRKVESPNG